MSVFQTSADYFRFFANEARAGGSPLYERFSLGIAGDERIQRLAARRRQGQPAANLIFAAAHYLLLGGAQDGLRDYYPSVGGKRAADDEAYGLFRAFCLAHEAEIEGIISQRVTNTNEVGRSALLAPLFELVQREAGAALGLVEIGPSAGLNLNFDRYGYRYTDSSGKVRLERGLNARFVLTCALRGSGVPAFGAAPASIASRIGLELAPIDPSRETEQRWLKALIWPERTDRLARLDGALRVAAEHPPPIRGGDALVHLPEALRAIPRDQARCVYHTIMAYQLSRDQYVGIDSALLDASKTAPVWRVTVESEVAGQNPQATTTPLKIWRYMDGERTIRAFGFGDPHGLWIDWSAG